MEIAYIFRFNFKRQILRVVIEILNTEMKQRTYNINLHKLCLYHHPGIELALKSNERSSNIQYSWRYTTHPVAL